MLLSLTPTALAAGEAKEEIVLTIYEQTGEEGEAKVLKSYTQSEYEALLTQESLTYSYMSEPYEMTATGYVTLSELLGEAFGKGDTLRYMCHEKDGSVQEYKKDCARSYEDLIETERYYYAAADAEGVAVPSVLSATRRLYVGETDGYRTQSGSFWPGSILFEKEGELVFDPWLIKEIGGVKIGFVGVTTPDTLRSSIPRYFQDENGNYIYGFMTDETGEAVYNAVQQSVDAARAAGADYVIVLGHMGNSHNYQPWMYSDVISHCSGIDAWLDGHTHDTDQVVMKDRDGKEVVRAACGTKLAHIGALRITPDGKISSELLSWDNSVPASKLLPLDNAASKAVSAASDELNALLAEVAAVSEVDLRSTDPDIRDFSGRPLLLIRVAETNLGNLIADAFRWAGN